MAVIRPGPIGGTMAAAGGAAAPNASDSVMTAFLMARFSRGPDEHRLSHRRGRGSARQPTPDPDHGDADDGKNRAARRPGRLVDHEAGRRPAHISAALPDP